MRKCRIFTTNNNNGYQEEGFPGDYDCAFTDAFLTDDGFVLSSELCWRTLKWKSPSPDDLNGFVDMSDESAYEEVIPAKIIDGQKLYTPWLGAFISRNRDNNRLKLPFEVDGKWGYCAAFTGEVIEKPTWNFCDDFQGAFARIFAGKNFDPMNETYEEDGLWGVIECDYNYGSDYISIDIPPTYQYLSRLSDDCARLAKKDGKWGAIDNYGKVLVSFEWDAIWFDFRDYPTAFNRYGNAEERIYFVVLKQNEGRKNYFLVESNGIYWAADGIVTLVKELTDFTPPEFPIQYIFDEEEDEEESVEDWQE